MTTDTGPPFLGRLLARALPPAADGEPSAGGADAAGVALPRLERRRPGLFEPRGAMAPQEPPAIASDEIPPATARIPPAAPMPPPVLQAPLSAAPPPSRTSPPQTLSAVVPVRADDDAPRPVAAAVVPALPPPPSLRQAQDMPSAPPRRRQDEPPMQGPRGASPPVPAVPAATDDRAAAPRPVHPVAADAAPARRHQRSARATPPVDTGQRARSVEPASHSPRHAVRESAPPPPLPLPPRLVREAPATRAVAHPGRTALHAPAPRSAPPSPAAVQVSIGRVEIRSAVGGAAAAPATGRKTGPQLALDDYLRQRHGSG